MEVVHIGPNDANGGVYCVFQHDGLEYFADVCTLFDGQTECMIFRSEDGNIKPGPA